jgi:hypothetical protein
VSLFNNKVFGFLQTRQPQRRGGRGGISKTRIKHEYACETSEH